MPFNFGYASGGGAGALKEVMEQQFQKAQFEEQLRARQVEEARLASAMKLEQDREARIAQDSQRNFDELQATHVTNELRPDDLIDEPTADLLKRTARGSFLKTRPGREAESALDLGAAGTGQVQSFDDFLAAGAAKKGVSVDQLTDADRTEAMQAFDAMSTGSLGTLKTRQTITATPSETRASKGGAKWDAQEANRQSRADAQAAALAARKESDQAKRDFEERENKRDRDLKEMMGRLAAAGQAESRDIRNRMLELQIQGIQEKQDTARTEKEKTLVARTDTTDGGLELIDSMLVHPGFGKATGAYEARGWTQEAQDFNGLRDQLVATLTLPNVGQLKGPLSDKDVLFIKQTVTRLGNTKLSAEATRGDLERLREKLATARERIAEEASRATRGRSGSSNAASSTTTTSIPEYVRDPKTGKLVLK